MTIWSSKKLELASIDEASQKFFVRLEGSKEQNEAKVKEVFGTVTEVKAGFQDEYAFITPEMKEKAFGEAVNKFENMISRIRVAF
jgi:homoserine dehydrogenase